MAASDHVLVVDDDPEIRSLVGQYFSRHGFKVTLVSNGKGMQKALEKKEISLIVLDLVLENEDGLELCRNLRATSDIPVLILSAKGEEMDRIIGLEMGADDYLCKPFHPRELLARVKSILRRVRVSHQAEEQENHRNFRFSGWVLDSVARILTSPEGKVISLSGSEHNLLSVFLTHPNRVLSRDQLLDFSQGRETDPFDRTIDMQVSRLRKRLQDDSKDPRLIKTVRSAGYIFCARVERNDS
ncbi:MAG: response regulator [Magnetococcales bacterium]|nr:response regulator [Magnetococcales bacterium]